jgi:histidinol phosphatase-like PHP family hydrolase
MQSISHNIPYDLHVHTYYSPCARELDEEGSPLAAPERYLAQAAQLGLKALAFTDHFVQDPTAPGVVLFYKGTGPGMLANLRSELARLNPPTGIEVLVGCETETMRNDWIGIDPEFARSLDLVLVPTTHYHLPDVPRPLSWAPADVATHMLDRLEAVVQLSYVHAVAHPFADDEELIGDLRALYEAMPPARLRDVLGLAAESGVALEVNGGALTSEGVPHYPAVYAEICRMAKLLGVRFVYGSDAHDYRRLGMTPEVAHWIAEVGLSGADFLGPDDLRARKG